MKGAWFSRILFLAASLGLFAGLAWFVRLRFETGEAYPRLSSMRADPLGSKALYESLATAPGVAVSRNFTPFLQTETLPSNATLLVLNTWGWQMHALADFDTIKDFVEQGGRLVIALNADHVSYEHLETDADETEDPAGKDEDSQEEPSEENPSFKRVPVEKEKEFWGDLSLAYGQHKGGKALLTQEAKNVLLQPSLPWREGGILENLGEAWSPVYQMGEEVVAAERALGQGSIVVLTDDYLFSNEALLKHREPEFLYWILGGKSEVIFEETHLGVAESTGVAVLMRRYRLGAFFLGFFCFMTLVAWRGALPLLPPLKTGGRDNVVLADHSSEAGLADLIRRSMPYAELPQEAFSRWKSSFVRNTADQTFYARELQEAEALLERYQVEPTMRKKPYEIHLAIKSIINRKKRKRL